VRFLIVDSDYPAFVQSLYEEHPGLDQEPYAVQLQARHESLFGVAQFYAANLRALGHEADDVHMNVEPLQRAWAAEHGVRVTEGLRSERARRRLGRLLGARRSGGWLERVLEEQVRRSRPDVLLLQDMPALDPRLVRRLKAHVDLLVGEHAATPIQHDDRALAVYDLVLSSFPPTVEAFQRRGIQAARLLLGFDPQVLEAVPAVPRRPVVTFVGSLFSRVHGSRIRLLEEVASRLGGAFELWTTSVDSLPPGSPLRARHRGPAWGREMYRVLRESTVTLNEHGSIEPHANNLRLYEATGIGTALVTDWKPDLGELFEVGQEVAAYRSAEECVELVEHYLERPPEREALASAGQQRTLADHSFRHRMEELVELVAGVRRKP
jgi:spore maturation protein CgeB